MAFKPSRRLVRAETPTRIEVRIAGTPMRQARNCSCRQVEIAPLRDFKSLRNPLKYNIKTAILRDLVPIYRIGASKMRLPLLREMPTGAAAIFCVNELAFIAPTYFSFSVVAVLRRCFAC
jgi:hypothetical protein